MEENETPMQEKRSLDASPEQELYANLLAKGVYLGLVCLLVTFAIYVSGLIPPYIPLEDLPHYWSMPVTDYLREADVGTGWSWISKLGCGDFLNFIGVAFLGGITIICYAAIIPGLIKRGDKTYALLALIEVIILTVAASGILAVGH